MPNATDLARVQRDQFLATVKSEQLEKQMTASLMDADPVRARRIAAYMANAAIKAPALYGATKSSIIKVMLDCCAAGIEPNGRDAYILPYRTKDGTQAQLIISYQGFITLATKSERVSTIRAEIVCENDDFTWEDGVVHHRIDFFKNRGEMVGVYAVATMRDGSTLSAVLTKEDVDKTRARSRAKDSGPWVTDYMEMAKKGLAIDTPIPTPQGWATMGDIKVGDVVFDCDGARTFVTSKSEVKRIECFRITFSNGETVTCDNEHRWVARIGNAADYKTVTINELFDAKSSGKHVTLPYHGAIALPPADLPVDPYLLGYWLGDGSSTKPSITCSKDDLPHVLAAIKRAGYRVGAIRTDDAKDRSTEAATVGITDGMLVGLRACGVLGDKHVPPCYLRGSIPQRRALLAGLLDSDGHCDATRGRAVFSSTRKELADAVYELACSLGEHPYRYEHVARGFGIETVAYDVGWKPTFNPFTLERKASHYSPRKITPYVTVKSIERVESVPTQCIAVDSPTHTYLCGSGMFVTHNTAVRRLAKYLPLSPSAVAAIQADDEQYDFGQPAAPKPAHKTNADDLASALAGGDAVDFGQPAPADAADLEPAD